MHTFGEEERGDLFFFCQSLFLSFPPSLFVSFPILLGIPRTFFGKGGAGKEEEGRRKDVRETPPRLPVSFQGPPPGGCGIRQSPSHSARGKKGKEYFFFTFLVSALLTSHGRISLQVGFPLPRGLPPPASSSSSLSCSEGPNKSSSSLLPSPPL